MLPIDFYHITVLSNRYAKNRSYNESVSFQLLKLQEEIGEAAQAFIGVTGANPRKGLVGNYGDLADEIIDVIVTGYVALETILVSQDVTALELYCDNRIRQVIDRALNASQP